MPRQLLCGRLSCPAFRQEQCGGQTAVWIIKFYLVLLHATLSPCTDQAPCEFDAAGYNGLWLKEWGSDAGSAEACAAWWPCTGQGNAWAGA